MRLSVIALSVALAVFAASCGSTSAVPAATGTTAPATRTGADLGEQRSDAAAVTVVAIWLPTGAPAARVTLDTHSVDLDGFDLKALARVRLDGGPWVTSSGWDAPKGGHHREGTLTFAAVDRSAVETATLIELEIRDVAVPSRILRWERPR